MKKLALMLALSIAGTACMLPVPEPTVSLPEVQLSVVDDANAVWKSSDYDKKPVLVVFMGSWCPYCKMTMPAVTEIAKKYGDKMEVVAIFMDSDPAKVKAVTQAHNFNVKSLYDGGELAESLDVKALPHIVLFDKKHRSVKHWEGYSDTFLEKSSPDIQRVL